MIRRKFSSFLLFPSKVGGGYNFKDLGTSVGCCPVYDEAASKTARAGIAEGGTRASTSMVDFLHESVGGSKRPVAGSSFKSRSIQPS